MVRNILNKLKELHQRFKDWKPIHLCWWFSKHHLPIPPYLIGKPSKFTQAHFRWYADGTEDGSTPTQNEDANDTAVVTTTTGNVIRHIRFMLQETNAGSGTETFDLMYKKNGAGSYAQVGAATAGVRCYASASIADGAATTNRATNGLTNGSGSWFAGAYDEADGALPNITSTVSGYTELLFSIQFTPGDTADGDYFDFEVYNADTVINSYSKVPRFTIDKGDPPTVALGTPNDGATISDTTPDLYFTGTDTDGDQIDYEVQVDTAATFNNQTGILVGSSAIDRSMNRSFASGETFLYRGNPVSNSTTITKVKFYAGFGITGVKIGFFYGSGTSWTCRSYVTVGDTSAGLTSYDCSLSVQAGDIIGMFSTNSIAYWVDGEASGGSGELYYAGDAFTGGPYTFTLGSAVSILSIEGEGGVPLISALSTDHTGFSVADAHPTNSGTEIYYTVQTALVGAGPFYWRVRGTDPSGSNTWGAWSPGDSELGYDHFHISAGPPPEYVTMMPLTMQKGIIRPINY